MDLSHCARVAVPALVLAAVVALGRGLALSNSVEPHGAGDGAAATSRYRLIGAPVIALDVVDPQEIASVAFALDPVPPATTSVKVKVGSQSAAWHSCLPTGFAVVTCPVPGASALAADELRIVVAD